MPCEMVAPAPESERSELKPLSRDSILSASDINLKPVEVTEWGGLVYLRSMSGIQRDRFEQRCTGKNLDNIRATLVALTACDGSGQRLFGDADIPALGDKSAAALDRLFWASMELNRIGEKDVEELKKT